MSTEQQIAALVSAANGLTTAVNNKIVEIDKSVLAAVRTIPNMSKELFVDAVDGSDLALGTASAPLKTIGEAMSRTGTTPYVMINLKASQTHEFSGPNEQMCYRAVSNKLVFSRWGSGSNPVFAPRVGEFSPGASNLHFLSLEGGAVYYRAVDVVMPTVLKPGTSGWYYFGSSLFYRGHGLESTVQGSVSFSGSVLKLGVGNVFYSGYTANYRVDVNMVTIDTTVSSSFADLSGGTMVLSTVASTITGGKSWGHLIKGVVRDSRGSLSNFLSNIGGVVADEVRQ
ncbi:hypothetical protein ACI77M_00950 [Pseudomonas fildesensis]|uniref:hypothetical protein n=1 Tax=Pseudomonas fildesensis TaxID=1674920 RepID=UPI00387B1BF7